jgi:Putative regulator of cell autolysis
MKLQILFFSLLLLFPLLGKPQLTLPNYKQYTAQNGLIQMQVWSLFQDSRGYIWVGTKGGLSRFNGGSFTNYTEKDGLLGSIIEQIVEDWSGNIWLVTQKGLTVFNGEKLKSFSFPELAWKIKATATPDGRIWYIGNTTNGKQIFGYLGNGNFHNCLDKFSELKYDFGSQITFNSSTNSILIINANNLYDLANDQLKLIKRFSGNTDFIHSGTEVLVNNRVPEKNENKLYEIENDSTQLIADIINSNIVKGNLEKLNLSFCPDADSKAETINAANNSYINVNVFPRKQINAVIQDRDGQTWVGTEEGLIKVLGDEFETYQKRYLPSVWGIAEDKKHNIWFSSLNYGIRKLEEGKLVEYPNESLKNMVGDFYYQPQVDPKGTIYFPSEKGVLYYENNQFNGIPGGVCMVTQYDAKRNLLFAGFHKLAIAYNEKQQPIREIGTRDGIEIDDYISAMGMDQHDNIWMGGGTGLVKYNWDTKKIENFNLKNKRLPSEGVMCIYTDQKGVTWFGGTDGLLQYRENSDSIVRVKSNEITEKVNLIISIDSTWLLFSQPSGIYLMDLIKYEKKGVVDLHLLSEQNGFISLGPGQNGAMKDSKGNIWMTTGTEVVRLIPQKINLRNSSLSVLVTEANGKPLAYSTKEVALQKNNRSAVIRFESVCFNRPKSAEYSYCIGESKHWSNWQKEDYAVFPDLPDGESEIKIRTRIPGLPGSEASTSIKFVVSVAIWRQPWFFPTLLVFVSLLVLLTIVLLVRMRAKMLQINRQAKTFQLQAILSQMNPHFIFNVMASLQSMILSANTEKANDYLVRMSNLVRGFLEASISTNSSKSKKLKNGEMPLKSELDILTSFIEFQQLVYPDRFEFELSIDENINPAKVTIPPMLIQPFVENAIRHGLLLKEGKGTLLLKISYEKEGQLQIVISDDGIGIKKAGEIIGKSPLLYTSRGRELTEKRIKLLNEMGYHIGYKTESSDQGTTVTINLNKHES